MFLTAAAAAVAVAVGHAHQASGTAVTDWSTTYTDKSVLFVASVAPGILRVGTFPRIEPLFSTPSAHMLWPLV
jgi:membrane-associated HD superfamily phosphohydrolase